MTEKVSILNLCLARAVDRYGMIKGGRVAGRQAAFISEWAMYQAATGDTPGNAHAFARWNCVSIETSYRHLREFCELFPEHTTPTPLASYVRAHHRPKADHRAAGSGALA